MLAKIRGMKTARDIIDFVGKDTVSANLDVGAEAVRVAYRNNRIPALWYDAMEQLAGRPLPRDAFSFRAIQGADE